MKIIKTSLPNDSVLNTSQKNYDFSDSFEGVFKDSQNIKTIKNKGWFFLILNWIFTFGDLFNWNLGDLTLLNEFIG